MVEKREPLEEIDAPSPRDAREDWVGSAAGTGAILDDLVAPFGRDDWEACAS